MKMQLEDKLRSQFMYRGNGDPKDKLDMFVADYLRKNKLYIDTLYLQHGVYMIGAGFGVKVCQTSDKLLVSDGPNHLASTFIKVERHLEKNCPKEWTRLQIIKDNEKVKSETVAFEKRITSVAGRRSPTASILATSNLLNETYGRQKSLNRTLNTSKSSGKLLGRIPSHVISEYLKLGETGILKAALAGNITDRTTPNTKIDLRKTPERPTINISKIKRDFRGSQGSSLFMTGATTPDLSVGSSQKMSRHKSLSNL